MHYPITSDGRYFLVLGRLWRMSDPSLDPVRRDELVKRLMAARSAKSRATKHGDSDARDAAKKEIDRAKRALGERGAVWWDDGAPDFNRHLARNTSYADWAADQ